MREPHRPLPRLGVLREMTDRAVLEWIFTAGRTTRTELAARTGISKPTISESVRRLESAGLLHASGSHTTGRRGRVATFYDLAAGAGQVVAIEANQQGIHAVAADLTGAPLAERHRRPTRPGDGRALARAIRKIVPDLVIAANRGPARAVALSVANPVDPETREIITLPDSPFPEAEAGALPAGLLADLVAGPVLIDNDVNFSALAERSDGGGARDAASFCYVYAGAGLGLSLYVGDQLVRGAHGLAGEIGYLNTTPGAAPTALADALARLGFGRADAPSLDVDAVLDALDRARDGDRRARTAVRKLGILIGEAVAAACIVADPDLVLLGGPIGRQPELLDPVRATVAANAPAPVRIELSTIDDSAPLRGALLSALDAARASLLTS